MQFNIQNNELRTLATNGKVINEACDIIKNNFIQDIIYLPSQRILSALIAYPPQQKHFVSLLLRSNGRPSKFQCTCEHSKNHWGFCQHVTALIMQLNKQDLENYTQTAAAALKLQKLATNKAETPGTATAANTAADNAVQATPGAATTASKAADNAAQATPGTATAANTAADNAAQATPGAATAANMAADNAAQATPGTAITASKAADTAAQTTPGTATAASKAADNVVQARPGAATATNTAAGNAAQATPGAATAANTAAVKAAQATPGATVSAILSPETSDNSKKTTGKPMTTAINTEATINHTASPTPQLSATGIPATPATASKYPGSAAHYTAQQFYPSDRAANLPAAKASTEPDTTKFHTTPETGSGITHTAPQKDLAVFTLPGTNLLARLLQANLRHEFQSSTENDGELNYEFVLTLPNISTYSAQHGPRLALYIGHEKLYMLANWWQSLEKRQDGEDIKLGKNFIWQTALRSLPAAAENFLDYLSGNLNEDSIYTIEQRTNSFSDWPLTQHDFNELVRVKLAEPGLKITVIFPNGERSPWHLTMGWPDWTLCLADVGHNNSEPAYTLAACATAPIEKLSYGITLYRQGEKFYRLPPACAPYSELLNLPYNAPVAKAAMANLDGVRLTTGQAKNLATYILYPLREEIKSALPPEFVPKVAELTVKPNIWLSITADKLEARLRINYNKDFYYDPKPLDSQTLIAELSSPENSAIPGPRLIKEELKWLHRLKQAGFRAEKPSNLVSSALLPATVFTLPFNAAAELFLTSTVSNWQKDGAVFYAEKSLQPLKLRNLPDLQGEVSIDKEKNQLDISIYNNSFTPAEWKAILKAYHQNRYFVKLKNGEVICWNQAVADSLQPLSYMEEWGGTFGDEGITLPTFRALPLLYLLEENGNWRQDDSLAKLRQALINPPESVELTFNSEIETTIRQYQRAGVGWFKELNNYGLSGILADDMGLGKTLQTLAYISQQRLQQKDLPPALIISPTSLLYNWLDEINRFAPHLKSRVIRGIKEKRDQEYRNMTDVDVLILSYPQVRQDIDELKTRKFSCVFLDEAQAIKNYRTHTSQAVKQLHAAERFALTGTPIENNLSELWSVFDFLMPGFLYNHTDFQRKFEAAAGEKGRDALFSLRCLIRPFILRRLKSEVLTELPPKVETILSSPLLPEQSKIYQTYLAEARRQLQSITGPDWQNGERISTKHTMEILSLLTRLRQIACHPALFLENYHGSSGKLELLEEILTTALAGGHRILIFSQFTALLAIIKPLLERLAITYMYIDGGVSPKERTDLVNKFNAGEGEVFLISLKAGGTGLNLTGADTVILMDPWWNPAVEQQATDRSHRLGQQRRVQVYRLIAKGTIEEKIRNLQERKQNLIDQVVISGDHTLSHLKPEELLALFEV